MYLGYLDHLAHPSNLILRGLLCDIPDQDPVEHASACIHPCLHLHALMVGNNANCVGHARPIFRYNSHQIKDDIPSLYLSVLSTSRLGVTPTLSSLANLGRPSPSSVTAMIMVFPGWPP